MARDGSIRDRTARLGRAAALVLALVAGIAGPAAAQDPELTFFRIATGGVNGTYYPIGAIIGNAISNPAGSRPCGQGGSCGVPNLIAAAVSSNGSVANVEAIETGQIESAFAQADVVHDAYYGKRTFDGRQPMQKLRVIANLYAERMQVVVRRGIGIAGIRDLAGKRVSLDEPGSGTLLMARLVLKSYGLAETDVVADYLKPGPASSLMLRDELDAFVIVAGVPTNVVADLTANGVADLLALDGAPVDKILETHPFLARTAIPAETYWPGAPEIPTIGVGAQWIVSADVPEERVYAICRALWNTATRVLLDGGHPAGKQIRLETALDGIDIPLHPGAARCYDELGVSR
ncbi:TAXI family TRAP transporter solute-binding subunit [Thalassobaculum sp.]|uniref:TAXI family TRAP transporter solute-binding subunit n=1 Tax=Thalassobaculum sp. TaxID=2022740 RepID=UPI0032EE9772